MAILRVKRTNDASKLGTMAAYEGELIANTQHRELYIGTSSTDPGNVQKLSDVVKVATLPTTGFPDKLYILTSNDTLYRYDTGSAVWIQMSQSGTTGSGILHVATRTDLANITSPVDEEIRFIEDENVFVVYESETASWEETGLSLTDVYTKTEIDDKLALKAESAHAHTAYETNISNLELNKEDKIHRGTTAPSNMGENDLWLDISTEPALLKRYDGVSLTWKTIGASSSGTGDTVTDSTTNGNITVTDSNGIVTEIVVYDDSTLSTAVSTNTTDISNLQTDVSFKLDKPSSATDNQVLTYNSSTGVWEAQDAAAASGASVSQVQVLRGQTLSDLPSPSKGQEAVVGSTNYLGVEGVQHPEMTANTTTTSEGDYVATASSTNLGQTYFVFKTGDYWTTSTNTDEWVALQFPNSVIVNSLDFKPRSGVLGAAPDHFKVEGSNDGISWTTLAEELAGNGFLNTVDNYVTYNFNNSTAYSFYRLYYVTASGSNYCSAEHLIFHVSDSWEEVVEEIVEEEPVFDASQVQVLRDDTFSNLPLPKIGQKAVVGSQNYIGVKGVQHPDMTADTTTTNEGDYNAIAKSIYGSYSAYKGLNSASDYWISVDNFDEWLGMIYPKSVIVTSLTYKPRSGVLGAAPDHFKVEGSNDGTTWTTLAEELAGNGILNTVDDYVTYNFTNSTAFTHYRLYWVTASGSNYCSSEHLYFTNIDEWEAYDPNIAKKDDIQVLRGQTLSDLPSPTQGRKAYVVDVDKNYKGETGVQHPEFTQKSMTTTEGTYNSYEGSAYGSYEAWQGLNDNNNYNYISTSPSNEFVAIEFPNSVIVNSLTFKARDSRLDQAPDHFKIEGSNDGTTWTVVDEQAAGNGIFTTTYDYVTHEFSNSTAFTHYRLYWVTNGGHASYCSVYHMYFTVADTWKEEKEVITIAAGASNQNINLIDKVIDVHVQTGTGTYRKMKDSDLIDLTYDEGAGTSSITNGDTVSKTVKIIIK